MPAARRQLNSKVAENGQLLGGGETDFEVGQDVLDRLEAHA